MNKSKTHHEFDVCMRQFLNQSTLMFDIIIMISKIIILIFSVLFTTSTCAELSRFDINSANEASDYFQYIERSMGWAQVFYCSDQDKIGGIKIGNCKNPYSYHALVQASEAGKGVFFEMDAHIQHNMPAFTAILDNSDARENIYGVKVARGAYCGSNCDIMEPLIKPKYGKLALMFAEEHLDNPDTLVGYSITNIRELLEIYKNKIDPSVKDRTVIVLNLNHLANIEWTITEIKFPAPMILYQRYGQPAPDMNMAKKVIDDLRGAYVQLFYILPDGMKLRLESVLPSADWLMWRSPSLHISSLALLAKFLREPRRLVALKTRSCDCDEPYSNRLSISRGTCDVLADHLLVQMRFHSYVALLECSAGISCDELYLSFPMVYQPFPFYLITVANGPNSNGSASDYTAQSTRLAQVHYIIGFQESLGYEKTYSNKHIGEVLRILNNQKFLYPMGLHMRMDFLAKSKITDFPYFDALLTNKKFGFLFIHNGEGFKSDGVEPTLKYTCGELNNVKYNIRKMNRETFLLVNDETRSGLFTYDDCSNEVTGTAPTLLTQSTTKGAFDPFKNVTFPEAHEWDRGVNIPPNRVLQTIILLIIVNVFY